MNFFRAFILVVLFYFLFLFQASFLVHLTWHNAGINLVLLVFIVLLFNKKRDIKEGLLLSALAGFFLDVFSSHFFGLYILLFTALFFFVSQIKKRILANNVLGFSSVLFIALLLYYFLSFLASHRFNLFDILYNFLAGLAIYFIFKSFYVFKQGIGK